MRSTVAVNVSVVQFRSADATGDFYQRPDRLLYESEKADCNRVGVKTGWF